MCQKAIKYSHNSANETLATQQSTINSERPIFHPFKSPLALFLSLQEAKMVELSGKDDPFQHGFPNIVFILPAIVVAGLAGK